MHWLYIIALLPVIAGFVAWVFSDRINILEWGAASAAGFIVAAIIHIIAFYGMVGDVETWSGRIVQGRQFSAWKEYYEYAVYRTESYQTTESYSDSKGRISTRTVTRTRQVFDHWEPTTRWHDAFWKLYSDIGTDYNVTSEDFTQITKLFNDRHAVPGRRSTSEHNSRMIGGDPNDYVADNRTGYIVPITDHRTFENRIKAAPSTFSFQKVPKDAPVYAYPGNGDPFHSERLLGTAAKTVDLLAFDQMNARLGPMRKVNVILVGFGERPSSIALLQQAKWVGGKKNDLVICYGNGWAKVFGWTERESVKRNLEDIVFAAGGVTTALLPTIEEEIIKSYVICNWSQYDYIAIDAPLWAYVVLVLSMGVTQAGIWYWAWNNDIDKQLVNGKWRV